MQLTEMQITKIEDNCKNKRLLTKNENFIEEINIAKAILDSISVNKEDIQIAFNNILLMLYKTNDYQAYTTLEVNNKEINEFVETVNKLQSDYTIETTVYNQIHLKCGKTLKVFCQTINEFEKSPIDLAICTNEDHLSNFDKIYFIIDVDSGNKIWFTDMSLYHIDKYGFFGGSKCVQYIDPYNLAQILGLHNLHFLKVNKEYRWRSRGKIIKKIICNIDRTYKDKKSGIKFYLYDNGKKLCIKFKNPEWIKEHVLKFIKILGVLLLVTNEYYDKNWHLCEIVYEDFLEDGDVSEQNNYIKICEDEVLVVRGELIQEDIVDIFINR